MQPLVQRDFPVDTTSDRFSLRTVEPCVRNAEVEGSTPFRSTLFQKKPFDEHVEGLSYCGDKFYAFEPRVQKDDIEDSTLRRIVRCNPLLPQCLTEFKNFRC